MLTFKELLIEGGLVFYQYKALVRVTYNSRKDMHLGAEKIAEILRAVPGATRVSTASLNKSASQGIFNVRIISKKGSKEAFIKFKENCLKRFSGIIINIEIGAGSIETKNFVS